MVAVVSCVIIEMRVKLHVKYNVDPTRPYQQPWSVSSLKLLQKGVSVERNVQVETCLFTIILSQTQTIDENPLSSWMCACRAHFSVKVQLCAVEGITLGTGCLMKIKQSEGALSRCPSKPAATRTKNEPETGLNTEGEERLTRTARLT